MPQLYNLADTNFFGHGTSFRSIKDVVKYKNTAVSQKPLPEGAFQPLFLSEIQVDNLTVFLTSTLRDKDLSRYVTAAIPRGQCSPVNDTTARQELSCNENAKPDTE